MLIVMTGMCIRSCRPPISLPRWLRLAMVVHHEDVQLRQAAPILTTVVTLTLAGCADGGGAGAPGPAVSSAAAPTSRSPASPLAASSRPAARRLPRPSAARAAASLAEVHDPGWVTGVLTGPYRARDDGLLPSLTSALIRAAAPLWN